MKNRARTRLGALVALLLLVSEVTLVSAARPAGAAAERCFPETGKCVGGRFLDYWLANGGLPQQGYPITDEFDEVNPADGNPYKTQYFERARFEYHPENPPPYDVLLGLLGREQYLARYPNGRPPRREGQVCFDSTNRCISGLFYRYWLDNGGLAQQGYPLSDEFDEVSPTNGKTYRVQYFERARFEHHPENAGTAYEVLLGLLGREQFQNRYGTPRRVTFSLPAIAQTGGAAVILSSTPPLQPPTPARIELRQNDIVIGFLETRRELPMVSGGNVDNQTLPVGSYRVTWRQDQVLLIDTSSGQAFPSKPVVRLMPRDVGVPETIITLKDVCYSWHFAQVCVELSIQAALESDEQAKISEATQATVDALAKQGLLEPADINVSGGIADLLGRAAREQQPANAIVAPAARIPPEPGAPPASGTPTSDAVLVGALTLFEQVDLPGADGRRVAVPPGSYAVHATQSGTQWMARLGSADGKRFDVLAEHRSVRGQAAGPPEPPVAILFDFCLGSWFCMPRGG